MADTHPLRRFGTRAALLSVGLVLGVTLAPRVVGAEPLTPPVDLESQSVPVTVAATATTTSTSSSSTSTSTTTSSTTPPPTTPVTSALAPPLVVFRQPAEVGTALTVDRMQVRARAEQPRASTGPELPFTGSPTISILVSGLGALAIGALALWWGSRKRPGLDLPEPGPTG